MKLLRLFAFGVAIGVLASLGSAKLAQAGNAVERNSAPRHARPHSAVRALTASRLAQSNRNPARRPVPRHPSRSPVRTASTRVKPRFRSPGSAATPVRGKKIPLHCSHGASGTPARSRIPVWTASVILGAVLRVRVHSTCVLGLPPAPLRSLPPPPILRPSFKLPASPSVAPKSVAPRVSQHNQLAESYLPITQRSHATFHRGSWSPSRRPP
jgi:hypothetical protein